MTTTTAKKESIEFVNKKPENATIRDSHKIMVVNAGEIVEFESHDNLIAKKGFYYSLYMSQFKGKAPAGTDAATADFIST